MFDLAINGVIQLCISETILGKYEEVLRRDRLAIPREKVATALAQIREKGSLVTPTTKVDPATCPDDPDDLIFLECPEAATAGYLITGNRKHFPDRWKTTKIISVREFWEMIADLHIDNPT